MIYCESSLRSLGVASFASLEMGGALSSSPPGSVDEISIASFSLALGDLLEYSKSCFSPVHQLVTTSGSFEILLPCCTSSLGPCCTGNVLSPGIHSSTSFSTCNS